MVIATQPTSIGGYTLAIAKALEHYGVDSRRIMRAADIPDAMVNDPMVRLTVQQVTRLYEHCVEVTNDPYFGLTVARCIQMANLHALGYALAASSTLLDFCRRIERYFHVVSQNADVELLTSKGEVTLRMRTVDGVSPQTIDAITGFFILAMRRLYKPDFNPIRIGFPHPMPLEGDVPYVKLFKAPIVFDHSHVELVLPADELEQPLAGACAELAQVNDQVSTNYLAKLDKSDVIAQVRQRIMEFLPDGECSRNRVAKALAMSPASLQQKLTLRETSFQEILEDTRTELARGYLLQPSRSITETAFLLGFTDSSNFTRAFKRWTGKSPSQFRKEANLKD